jgi:hypothetical protein
MVNTPVDSALPHTLRVTLLLVISLSLVLIVVGVSRYPPRLAQRGGWVSGTEAAVLLIVHAAIVVWATRKGNLRGDTVLVKATAFGLISGGLEVVHISVENFAHLSARAGTISTGVFMFSLVLLWGIAGYAAARIAGKAGLGWLAGLWSATVAVLLTSAFGLILLNLSPHQLELNNIGSPDLIRSGWTDLRAFTIADLFEAVVKVLTMGPVLGAAFGGIGGVLAGIVPDRRRVVPLRRSHAHRVE